MALVKKKNNERSTCVLHLCCGDGSKKKVGCPFCGFSILVSPSNSSPQQKTPVYVCRGCIGERCLREYREGRNCTGKPVSEFGIIGKS